MMRSIVRMFLGLCLTASAAAPLAAQAGRIRGTVSDSAGTGLANAALTVEGTALRGVSRTGGVYEIRGVPAGTYTVKVRLIGYRSESAEVTVPQADEVTRDFTLLLSPVQLAPIDVVVGSRARHTAEEELAVPVDIFPAEELQRQGSTETSIILQSVSPSVNFPRQSVTDAGDIIRPFTLRGLSPDQTLVLVNGWRQHQTAVVNTFNYGMPAGSSGVDLNALPASALDRIEVLRDGASAQYGSDAIAGVVNLVMKDGAFTPFVNGDAGRYVSDDYADDGTTVNVNGGWGIGIGRGSLGVFGEFRDRQPTNRAWADVFEVAGTGVPDSIDAENGQVIEKRNPVDQPNHHWGDGLEKDVLADKYRQQGKPENVIEKIVESGLKTYYKEVCLLEQAFIHDEKGKSVAQAVKEAEGKIGAPVKIAGFVRYALGEGIEKQESDFAAEVAAASGKK
jgi:iron complex outermembrane receptor protein